MGNSRHHILGGSPPAVRKVRGDRCRELPQAPV